MPRIFDNIEASLLPALRETLGLSLRGDFCVGYFNLRGWKQIDNQIEAWQGGEGNCCRLLVGMQPNPSEELRQLLGMSKKDKELDLQSVSVLKKKLAEEFRNQLMIGIPTEADEAGLRRLSRQLRDKKVVVKLFLRHSLHAKLYLLFRQDPINPIIGYIGSSNLTLAGLSHQGELNIDVLDGDATVKLSKWFDDRWNDRWCIDISEELAEIINESWASEIPIPPYHIYLKIAYHLSQEARSGLSEFRIPKEFGNRLFAFQTAAVKIAAHHLNKRGGVLIGDVVGLGKTLMATALAKIFDDDHNYDTLIVCPKNLESMWQDYVDTYRLHAKVLSITNVQEKLPDLKRYRLILIDESHNLRNRDGKRYKALQDYIHENDCKCILLSATPYNKTYLDLANQLRLFIEDSTDIGIRPEKYIKKDLQGSETEFIRRHQCAVKSISAFEKSEYPDDWRELMRLYMVRRTRSFIIDNYAQTDAESKRRYLTLENGERSYFPDRIPKTVRFKISDKEPKDQYGRLYGDDVVAEINSLGVPRYGLGNYIAPSPHDPPTPTEAKALENLGRAGKRLMGFCRTNLFKRLESSGHAFLQSMERHILRNYVFLHAIQENKPLPIGTQDVGALDSRYTDLDSDLFGDEENGGVEDSPDDAMRTEEAFRAKAKWYTVNMNAITRTGLSG